MQFLSNDTNQLFLDKVQFIKSAKVSLSNAFVYFSILKLAKAMLKKALIK